MTVKRSDFPKDGRGNLVSDIRFLLSCLDFVFEATGETMDPEDMAVIAAIKFEMTQGPNL
jgi:hypothetical protein